jgi:imidazolonepropionase-like amidohydrolase
MEKSIMARLFSLAIFGLVFVISFLPLKANEKKTNLIYLQRGNLLDLTEGKIVTDSLVVIKGDTIQYAGPSQPFEKSADITVIDCSGKTLIPGLFDAHIHLGGASTLGYIPIDDHRKLSSFLYSGITSVFDLGAIQEWIFALREGEKKGDLLSPRIFAVGPLFTSPNGHGTEYGVDMSLTPTTEEEARQMAQKLIQAKPDLIKIIYEKGSKRFTSLSYELVETIIDEAHKNHFRVVTHILTFEQAKDALRAGTDGLAHMVSDREIDEGFLDEMKQKDIFCIPTLAMYESFSGGMLTIPKNLKGPLAKKGISREILTDLKQKKEMPGLKESLGTMKDALRFAKINAKKMHDKGIKLAVGTDAGNPAVFFGPSVHREMELLVEAGISPAEVLRAATINAAEILGQKERLGTIYKGKLADILVIEGNPLEDIRNTQNIFMVIKNGHILDREALARSINPPEKPSDEKENKSKTLRKAETTSSPKMDSAVVERIKEAKELMKKGVDTWDLEKLKKAREKLLGLLAKEKQESLYPLYYVALCDYRLANYFLISTEMDKVEPYLKEGQKYLEKAMEMDPDFGELDGLYAFLLGFEIAINQEKAMSLGLQVFQYSSRSLEKSPENPRVHYMKGLSDFFTPREYGGGPDPAIKSLTKSIALFEKEDIQDPVKPSWGEDEAYTFLGMAYNQKGETEKAKQAFKKALEINPEFGLARDELKKIEK